MTSSRSTAMGSADAVPQRRQRAASGQRRFMAVTLRDGVRMGLQHEPQISGSTQLSTGTATDLQKGDFPRRYSPSFHIQRSSSVSPPRIQRLANRNGDRFWILEPSPRMAGRGKSGTKQPAGRPQAAIRSRPAERSAAVDNHLPCAAQAKTSVSRRRPGTAIWRGPSSPPAAWSRRRRRQGRPAPVRARSRPRGRGPLSW